MTLIPAAALDAGASVTSSLGEAATATSVGGLSGGQKAGAVGAGLKGLLPKPQTTHPYIVGLALTVIGLAGLVGSITGSLPSMLAALFVPNALVDSSGNTAAPSLGDLLGQSPTSLFQELVTPLGPVVATDPAGTILNDTGLGNALGGLIP